MNKLRILAAIMAAAAAMSAVSCGGTVNSPSESSIEAEGSLNEPGDESSHDESSEDEYSPAEEEITEAETEPFSEQVMVADENAVPDSGAAPVLSASKVSGAAGETVDVTISISGADKQWAMCGVHITYDERLVCLASENDPKIPEYKKGAAVENITGFITMLQDGESRNQHLIDNKQSAVFFTAVDNANKGADGDIVTYSFKIPEDAASGTVYDIGFYYREGDMFLDEAKDQALQDYAFSHWEGGSVTVN